MDRTYSILFYVKNTFDLNFTMTKHDVTFSKTIINVGDRQHQFASITSKVENSLVLRRLPSCYAPYWSMTRHYPVSCRVGAWGVERGGTPPKTPVRTYLNHQHTCSNPSPTPNPYCFRGRNPKTTKQNEIEIKTINSKLFFWPLAINYLIRIQFKLHDRIEVI